MSKLQLHPSSMEMLAKCGIRYERRYLLKDIRPPSARMIIGTAVDRSVRRNLSHKIETGQLAELEQVKDEARDALITEWQNGVRLDPEDLEDGIHDRDKALDMSVNLSGFHHAAAAPKIHPIHVARKWVLDVEGLDIQIAGEIDIQEPKAIRDTKTSAKSPVKTLADESLQLSTYALAVERIDGQLPEKVWLDYLVQTPKRGDTKLVQLESTRRQEHLQPVMERIAQMDRILKAGIFTPAAIGSWWCSARFCEFHSTCRYAAKPVSVAVPDLERQLTASVEAAR